MVANLQKRSSERASTVHSLFARLFFPEVQINTNAEGTKAQLLSEDDGSASGKGRGVGNESTRLGNHIRRGRFSIRAKWKRAGKLAGKGHYKLV